MTPATDPTKGKRFVEPKHVETLVFDWGRLQLLNEPRVTGAQGLVSGVVTLEPGQGHDRHNHPNDEEIIYVLEGEGTQMVDEGGEVRRKVTVGTMIHLPKGVFHSTMNTSEKPMKLLVVYSNTGMEEMLRSIPGCRIEPAESPDAA